MAVKVLDLFSGIGGFSVGLERAGMTTVAFCEQDTYCQRVLRKHWPDAHIYDDVRELTGEQIGAVDVVCGGFPCQPFSTASAGKRYGKTHDHYLWPEMRRIVEEARPAWVIGENVAGIGSMAFDEVVSDLEGIGYDCQAMEIPACAVGQDHRRNRYWFLAHANRDCQSSCTIDAKVAGRSRGRGDTRGMGKKDGLSTRMDRLRALGNAVVPQIPEIIGLAIMEAHQWKS